VTWPLHDIACPIVYAEWHNRGGRGEIVYCAILIATTQEGVAIQEVLNAKNSIDQCTLSKYTNESLVKAKP